MRTIEKVAILVIIIAFLMIFMKMANRGGVGGAEGRYGFFSVGNNIYRGNTATGDFEVWRADLSGKGGDWQTMKSIKQSTYQIE